MPTRDIDRPSPRRPAALATLCLASLLLAGCAAQPQNSGQRQAGAKAGQSFTRVLVVGVSPSIDQRCGFEFFMASQLRSDSVHAVPSCDAAEPRDPLTLASIEQAVARVQADAVLATNLVSRSFKAREGGSADTRGNASYKAVDTGFAYDYYGMYGVPVVYGEFATAPAVTVGEGKVTVASRLYATADRALVYELDTTASNLESTDAALHDIAAAIAGKLRREGYTR